MLNDVKNILIVGVGGQGTLLASKLMGKCFLDKGFDVKVSEVHGMSQRGGSVVTYVRYGTEVFSPVIDKGESDMIIAFEELEAARWLPYLKKNGTIIVNRQEINPMPVIMGTATYPEDIIGKLRATVEKVISVDALSIAVECGNVKAANTVLLGVAARVLGFGQDIWLKAIETTVPAKTVELNKKAFLSGYNHEQ
ncbi:MAG TPA: indolepyruvate oxidoreductase subunit beta [Clostridiales bacterium]|nr:indolepyruvate oxidoreductase subunit beta [Eubacteriales bacterium]HBR31880.1 indolepyruvate oxidoreductase subunit beta [Clostridiales bacterium]